MEFKKILGALVLTILIVVLGAVIFARQSGWAFFISLPSPSPSPEIVATPTPTPTPIATSTPSPDPFADKPNIDISSWEYKLVNKDNLLAADYAPELATVGNGQSFDTRAADALKEFVAAAKAEGLTVYITSSYRSYDTQEYLFNKKVNEYVYSQGSVEAATEKAKTIVAYPGTSEHQLGLACDIVDQYYDSMNETLESTALSQWMASHCAEYGFILRFPKNKTDITGVMFEPWHFRYVGKEAAAYMTEKGLTLEEFVALYK